MATSGQKVHGPEDAVRFLRNWVACSKEKNPGTYMCVRSCMRCKELHKVGVMILTHCKSKSMGTQKAFWTNLHSSTG